MKKERKITFEVAVNAFEISEVVMKKICPQLAGANAGNDECGECEYKNVHKDRCALLDAIFMYQEAVDDAILPVVSC